MRMLTGVVAGLIAGAALVFATLAVLGIVTRDDACPQTAPQAWSIRVDVPVSTLQAEVPTAPIALGAGEYRITSVAGTDCGGLLLVGNWVHPDGPELDNVGVELVAEVSADGVVLRPRTLWFGRLPVDLTWVPAAWWQPLLADANAQLQATVTGSLSSAGMRTCGAAGSAGALSLYLCEAGASQ
jgi:hypothetical protein